MNRGIILCEWPSRVSGLIFCIWYLLPSVLHSFRMILPLKFTQSVEAVRDADVSTIGGASDLTSLRQNSLLDEKDVTSLRHDLTSMQTTLEEREVEVETLKKEVDSLNAFQVGCRCCCCCL